MTDAELISAYAQGGSEQAFAALFERHIDWVYGVALRRGGGDVEMARDVAQAIFILLARKSGGLAGLGDAALAGWLFRATTLTTKAALKSAARRRRHERRAAAMRTDTVNPAETPAWADLAPQLDGLVAKLPARDRKSVV